MRELLTRVFEDPPSDGAVTNVGGRTAELRAKFAKRLEEQSRKAFRPPVRAEDLKNLGDFFSPLAIPSQLVELWGLSDGENNEGLICQNLQFLRASYARKFSEANRNAISMGLVGARIREMVPFMRDSSGNQFLVPAALPNQAQEKSSVFLADFESGQMYLVSGSVRNFFTRIVGAHERAREIGIPGVAFDATSRPSYAGEEVGLIDLDSYPTVIKNGVTVLQL